MKGSSKIIEKVDISVIVPIYNESGNIRILSSKLINSLKLLTEKFELIYVDDGSRDQSIDILEDIKTNEDRLKIIEFERNYGMFSAIFAGMRYAKGDIVVTMDGDLQVDPAELPKFIEVLENYDIAIGWRVNRKGPILKRCLPSFIINLAASYLTKVRIHDRGCAFKAYRRKVIDDIVYLGNLRAFFSHIKNYKVTEVKIKHYNRLCGRSKFSYSFLIKLAISCLVLCSKKINRLFNSLGLKRKYTNNIENDYYVIKKIYE